MIAAGSYISLITRYYVYQESSLITDTHELEKKETSIFLFVVSFFLAVMHWYNQVDPSHVSNRPHLWQRTVINRGHLLKVLTSFMHLAIYYIKPRMDQLLMYHCLVALTSVIIDFIHSPMNHFSNSTLLLQTAHALILNTQTYLKRICQICYLCFRAQMCSIIACVGVMVVIIIVIVTGVMLG